MNRREAIVAGAVALLGGPVVAEARFRIIRGGCSTGKTIGKLLPIYRVGHRNVWPEDLHFWSPSIYDYGRKP